MVTQSRIKWWASPELNQGCFLRTDLQSVATQPTVASDPKIGGHYRGPGVRFYGKDLNLFLERGIEPSSLVDRRFSQRDQRMIH